MRIRKYRKFVADFETTVYDGQERTDVWAAACVEMNTEDVSIFHTIEEQFQYFRNLNSHIIVYYHNLKFDGEFWLSYLMNVLKYKQAYYKIGKRDNDLKWKREKHMDNNAFKYAISEQGQWYSIIIKTRNHFIEFRDSLKLLPFSVKEIGKAFKTKHQKLDMKYKGFRYPGCEITKLEKKYIRNDVLVVKEALEILFKEGHDSLTIGSCCLKEYKEICKTSLKNQLTYKEMFPNLYSFGISKEKHGSSNAGEWIRKSYRGGWCYLVKGKESKVYRNGTTADVNSLYPSMMHSESGSRYPVGVPHFFSGEIPEVAKRDDRYYFVRVKTRFYLKEGKLPFIQIRNNLLYKGNENLESSDVYLPDENGDYDYYTHYTDKEGRILDTRVELTFTMPEYELFLEHYNTVDFEILDGCWFYAQVGIFDEYIDKYKEIKMREKGAKRTLAKLFLNNLYGKMASSPDSSFKVAYTKEDGSTGYMLVHEEDKTPGYIACGSAITGWTRSFTIKAAQKNYHGKNKPGFIYADTDSLHCDLPAKKLKGIKVDDNAFCCWKLESSWDEAIFVRQKTYIEHITSEDLKPCNPYYSIKCAGMPQECKELFEISLRNDSDANKSYAWGDKELKFLFRPDGTPIKRSYYNFRPGLQVPGKLRPKRIPGGLLLVDSEYTMKGGF